jgi:hypothetical protein
MGFDFGYVAGLALLAFVAPGLPSTAETTPDATREGPVTLAFTRGCGRATLGWPSNKRHFFPATDYRPVLVRRSAVVSCFAWPHAGVEI